MTSASRTEPPGWMIAVTLVGGIVSCHEALADDIDLARAVVVVPDGLSGPESKAVNLLAEEVKARSRIG